MSGYGAPDLSGSSKKRFCCALCELSHPGNRHRRPCMKCSRLAGLIEKRIKHLQVSRAEFARRAGVSRSELYKLLSQDVGEARLSTLARLARTLEVPISLLFSETLGVAACTPAGITEPRYPEDVLAVARSDEEECAAVAVGEEFTLQIRLCNVGTTVWQGRRLACLDGYMAVLCNGSTVLLGGEIVPVEPEIPVPHTMPGGVAQFKSRLRAPKRTGAARVFWKMVDERGAVCFPGIADVAQRIHVFKR